MVETFGPDAKDGLIFMGKSYCSPVYCFWLYNDFVGYLGMLILLIILYLVLRSKKIYLNIWNINLDFVKDNYASECHIFCVSVYISSVFFLAVARISNQVYMLS